MDGMSVAGCPWMGCPWMERVVKNHLKRVSIVERAEVIVAQGTAEPPIACSGRRWDRATPGAWTTPNLRTPSDSTTWRMKAIVRCAQGRAGALPSH